MKKNSGKFIKFLCDGLMITFYLVVIIFFILVILGIVAAIFRLGIF